MVAVWYCRGRGSSDRPTHGHAGTRRPPRSPRG
jgi:hypothetical protein